MDKVTKLIIATVGLGGLGFFLYKKGFFSNSMATNSPAPVAPQKTTLKNAPTCESGFKLQMVDINCNGQDCEVHCVPIPAVPERKLQPLEPELEPLPLPSPPPFKAIPNNPTIFYPNTSIPVEVVVNPYVGIPQNPYVPVTDNSFKPVMVEVEQDPFGNIGRGKGSLDYELNQMLYR